MDRATVEAFGQFESNEAQSLTYEEIFDALGDSRRRQVVRVLSIRESETDMAELARHVAGLEDDVPVASVTERDRRRVQVSLSQTHVPMLASLGVVDYDREAGVVSLGTAARDLTPYLDGVDRHRRRWYRYYLALVAITVPLGGLAYLDDGSTIPVGDMTVSLLILGAFVALTAVVVSVEHG